jgi:hypothetical protein
MTFIVSHHGRVHQRSLGKNTATLVTQIADYNPDRNWQEVVD